jgi:hypothetical protein
VDPTLTLDDLASLGSRLDLPPGWSFAARVLSEDFAMIAQGEMINLQDELQNTYQKLVTDDPSDMNNPYFAAAAARAAGVGDSFFFTDATVSNAGAAEAGYYFLWLPRDEDNSNPISSETFALAPYASAIYTDVLGSVFDLGDGALGALLLVSDSNDLVFMTRTYNQADAGTYGQGMPAVTADELITAGERKRLVFFVENGAYRTNLGLLNATPASMTIRWEGFSSDGTSLGSGAVEMPPWGNTQINRVLSDEAPVLGASVDVWTETPGAAFTAYGSLVDNGTSDPTTILPR